MSLKRLRLRYLDSDPRCSLRPQCSYSCPPVCFQLSKIRNATAPTVLPHDGILIHTLNSPYLNVDWPSVASVHGRTLASGLHLWIKLCLLLFSYIEIRRLNHVLKSYPGHQARSDPVYLNKIVCNCWCNLHDPWELPLAPKSRLSSWWWCERQ